MSNKGERARRQRLRQCVSELIALAREIAPSVVVRELTPYEDEDIVLEVKVPSEFVERVDEVLSERSYDMLLNDGVFILLRVIPDEELTAAERREE